MTMTPDDIKSIVFTRYFLLGEIDASTAARELAVLPGLDLNGHYYYPGDAADFQRKLSALQVELEKVRGEPPAA